MAARGRGYDQELKQRALTMLQEGTPGTRVAKTLGISYATLNNWKRAAKKGRKRRRGRSAAAAPASAPAAAPARTAPSAAAPQAGGEDRAWRSVLRSILLLSDRERRRLEQALAVIERD